MTPEETLTEGIASLIAMLELMFTSKSGYYHRLLMVHCIVQPTWSPDSLLGISDGGGAPESVAKGTTNLTLHTRGDWGQPLHDYTAHRDIPIVVVLGLQFGNSS